MLHNIKWLKLAVFLHQTSNTSNISIILHKNTKIHKIKYKL